MLGKRKAKSPAKKKQTEGFAAIGAWTKRSTTSLDKIKIFCCEGRQVFSFVVFSKKSQVPCGWGIRNNLCAIIGSGEYTRAVGADHVIPRQRTGVQIWVVGNAGVHNGNNNGSTCGSCPGVRGTSMRTSGKWSQRRWCTCANYARACMWVGGWVWWVWAGGLVWVRVLRAFMCMCVCVHTRVRACERAYVCARACGCMVVGGWGLSDLHVRTIKHN